MSEEVIQYPWGPADHQDIEAGAVMEAEITNRETVLNITPAMAAAGTLNLTVSDQVPEGSNLTVKAVADATARTLTFGTGMTGKAYEIAISKHAVFTFKFDGTKFINTGAILTD